MSVSGANFVAEILELFGALCLAWPLFRDFNARRTLARISGVFATGKVAQKTLGQLRNSAEARTIEFRPVDLRFARAGITMLIFGFLRH